jgi:hypothetical protein
VNADADVRSCLALTNAHGLRLVIASGRIGFPPTSAAPARDPMSLTDGYPVVAIGRAPVSIQGAEGPLVGLRLSLADVDSSSGWAVPDRPGVVLAGRPIPLAMASEAVFPEEQFLIEFAAGLRTLDAGAGQIPFIADRAAFESAAASVGGLRPPTETGRAWSEQLDRQERVSAGLILGELVARGARWQRAEFAGLRSPGTRSEHTPLGRVRRCASALGRIDFVIGWSADELVSHLRARADNRMVEFALAHQAANDPFEDRPLVPPADSTEIAIAFLIDHQGSGVSELVDAFDGLRAYVDRPGGLKPADVSMAAALVGIAIGRSLLPQAIRPSSMDRPLVIDEIKAATEAIQRIASTSSTIGGV